MWWEPQYLLWKYIMRTLDLSSTSATQLRGIVPGSISIAVVLMLLLALCCGSELHGLSLACGSTLLSNAECCLVDPLFWSYDEPRYWYNRVSLWLKLRPESLALRTTMGPHEVLHCSGYSPGLAWDAFAPPAQLGGCLIRQLGLWCSSKSSLSRAADCDSSALTCRFAIIQPIDHIHRPTRICEVWDLHTRTCTLRFRARHRSRLESWSPGGAFICIKSCPGPSRALRRLTIHDSCTGARLTSFDCDTHILSATWHPSGVSLLVHCCSEAILVSFAPPDS